MIFKINIKRGLHFANPLFIFLHLISNYLQVSSWLIPELCQNLWCQEDVYKRQLKYVPEALESSLSPAFFLVPPIDSDGSNTIYINEKASTEQNLYTMLAHEGYPCLLYTSIAETFSFS